MADRVQYLWFDVNLTSKADAERYQEAYPAGVKDSPQNIATLLGIPIVPTTDPAPVSPSIRSAWITGTTNYPVDQASFTKCRGGWFGICFLFGRSTLYRWVGFFKYVPPAEATINDVSVVDPADIQQRSWIEGFEIGGDFFNWSGGDATPLSRGASRHPDGYGFAFRGPEDAGEYFRHVVTESGAAARTGSWERFYLRPRRVPDISTVFWMSEGVSALAGIHLELTPGLVIAVYNVSAAGVRTLVGTTPTPLAVDVWHKVDLLFTYGAGTFKIYIKGVLALAVTVAAGVGLGGAMNHQASRLGGGFTPANMCEIDFDDWMCTTIPPKFDGLDWLNGSKCTLVSPTAFNASNDWVGEVRALLHNPAASATSFTLGVTNAVSDAALIVDTDAGYTVDRQWGSVGCVAMRVDVARSIAGGVQTGKLGYTLGVGGTVLADVAENTSSYDRDTMMYRPAGLKQPIFTTPVTLHYVKAPNVNSVTAYRLMAEAELLGVFGLEDVITEAAGTVTTAVPPRLGVHNAPYPRSVWARQEVPPTAPVILIAGTYTGNGTGQDLQFRAPVNWFVVRRVATGGQAGIGWWTSLLGAHLGKERGTNSGIEGMIQASEDTTFVPLAGDDDPKERYLLKITGNSLQFNESGVTYQYVAVIDPGARFMLNGSDMHHATVASAINALKNALFTPQGLFLFQELSAASGTATLAFKGPGNAATGVSVFDAGELLNYLSFEPGQLTTIATNGHIPEGAQIGYNAWRTDDKSGDPGVPKVVKIGSYIGNASTTRSISLSPPSGVRPLYVLVVPANATAAVRRDPSHTGTTSSDFLTNIIASTGIISGGIDEFTVGLALNANAIVYNYFVLMGSATAGNNGWSVNGEFVPVEPEYNFDFAEPTPLDGPFDPINPGAPAPDPDPDPGIDDTDDCLAGDVCVAATTREVNRALLEIGNTKFLTNYCTQQTLEAQTARLLYESSVRAVLHAFPWPFATRYAVLSLAATQPSNQDWAFAYRQPVDCVFERRISVARATGVDPAPPPFELSSDSSGGLILTNEPAAVLEYTCRPACVSFAGDALFKEAFVWHLAAKLAPPLTRMADKAKFCMDQYELSIAKAHAIIRPDDPGLRVTPAWQAQDVGVGAMAANVEVANVALINLGARTIASLAPDQSREGKAVNLVFEHELKATLRDFPWKFAKRYNNALTLVGGTATVPVNPDWQYSFRLPADYVSVRRLVTEGTGRSFERHPKTFEVGTDATGYVLFTGEDAPNLEYTARIASAVLRADPLFREALAWRLVAALAPSLAQPDPDVHEQQGRGPEPVSDTVQKIGLKPSKAQARERAQRWAFWQYLRAIEKARVADANEAEPEPHGEAEWIEGRS